MKKNFFIFLLFCLITLFLIMNANAQTAQTDRLSASIKTGTPEKTTPLEQLKEDTLLFFQPVKGKIIDIDGMFVKVSFDQKESVLKGMRLQAFKEGADFIHPITKERLGKTEIPIGSIEIESIISGQAAGRIIKGKADDFKGAKVKIPAIKPRVLFYQGGIDWFLGDSYYQSLKDSGRFELVDTAEETSDISKIISEAKAKNAITALVMSSEKQDKNIIITQRLFWVDDSKQFSERKVTVSIDYVNELRLKSGLPGMRAVEMLFSYDLPFSANRITAGDFDGDRTADIALVSGDLVSFYTSRVDLSLLWQLKLPSKGEIVWIDRADIKSSGKEAILITARHDNDYISYIYELQGNEFVQLWRSDGIFIRGYGNKILGQKYSPSEGYDGNIFLIAYTENSFKKTANFKLPLNLNLYDFQYVYSPDGRQAILSWDENGFLKLLDESGAVQWMSKEDFGGFSTSFAKESLSGMFDKGRWSIKDRLIFKDGEVYAPKRKPILGKARGLGYKESTIKAFWWSGFTVEERDFIDDIGGEIIDYAVTEDRIMVLSKPLLGIKAKNILKGESPFGIMLYIFSTKGR